MLRQPVFAGIAWGTVIKEPTLLEDMACYLRPFESVVPAKGLLNAQAALLCGGGDVSWPRCSRCLEHLVINARENLGYTFTSKV